MPLSTQIIRNGEALALRWGGFHVAAMVYAVTIDSGKGPFTDNEQVAKDALRLMEEQEHIGISPRDAFELMDYSVIGATPLNSGNWTMTQRLSFIDKTDGEVLELLPGDVLSAGRY